MARKPTDTIKLNLRFPEALRRDLEREAARNNQSMNAEIVDRLERSFAADGMRRSITNLLRERPLDDVLTGMAKHHLIAMLRFLTDVVQEHAAEPDSNKSIKQLAEALSKIGNTGGKK